MSSIALLESVTLRRITMVSPSCTAFTASSRVLYSSPPIVKALLLLVIVTLLSLLEPALVGDFQF